ncbi:uncharacterized protein TNCV_2015201 [Trichonephila clavipes]|nr:uncharacterized protein TNCV_2015201 [Trichonephila clavipes]
MTTPDRTPPIEPQPSSKDLDGNGVSPTLQPRLSTSDFHLFPELKKNLGGTQFQTDEEFRTKNVAAVAEWYRYRIVACLVTSSSPVPPKTRRVGQRCTLNLWRAETSSRWCGVVVRRGGASSGVVHVT